jgi:hypothetical protein
VAGIDERVAYLEGRVEEHGHMVNGTRDAIVSLQSRMVSFEARVDQRLQSFEVRLQTFETRVDHRFLAIDSRFDAMDAKITRYFTWLIGLYVTGLIAIFSTLVAVVAR